jgi:hypothetical protein
MKYKLDASGYVCAVSFGCYLDACTEYTGEVPVGYTTLDDWATNACIQAYYIDPKGNLVIDFARKTECENKQAQEAIDYAPLLRKDLYETEEVLDSYYIRRTATGKVITLEDVKTIATRVKITGIEPGYNTLSIYTQGKNMMPCDAVSHVVSGVTFTKNMSGSITVLGTATENIEYIVSDGNTTPIFALKANNNYYLNLGGLQCELRYFDSETTAQQYAGASGLLNLPESIEVTQVVIKITSGDSVNTTFYPQLEVGTEFTKYETHKCKSLELDIGEIVGNKEVTPSDTLYAKDTLYPGIMPYTVDCIVIENGKVTVTANGENHVLGSGSVGLFSDYSTIYATKDVSLELEYSDNMIDVDSLEFLQGKSTTTNQFKILKDGSIEAHNGFFSGRIEADSGYFKGEISWEQVTDNEDVATKTYVTGLGYQTAPQVTKITKDTVTTQFVNALSVKAGSVDAECITGTIISGKKLQGATGDFEGKIKATSGEIGGFAIGTSSLYAGFKSSLSSTSSGVYVGTDGISVGSSSGVKVTSSGDVTINGKGSIAFTFGIDSMSLDAQGIEFSSGSTYRTQITKEKVQVYNTYMDADGLHVKGSATYYTNIEYNKITFGSGAKASILHGNNEVITLNTGNVVRIGDTYSVFAKNNGYLGFFGNTGSTKKTVATVATTATASTIATKLNELINALKAYNLIG